MKKTFSFAIVAVCTMFFVSVALNPASAQTEQKKESKAIPENVVKIAEKSCVKCHTEPGNKMALAHVNISKWDKYTPEKQEEKAKAMCKMVTEEKMPPKNFRKENPNDIPTKEDVKAICDWASSSATPMSK
jgi:hypothetical protein